MQTTMTTTTATNGPVPGRRNARSDRRNTHIPGEPMTGALLDEWCRNASSDPRDWFSVDERRAATAAFSYDAAQHEGQRPRIPFGIAVITGPVGAGKSAVANYICSTYKLRGAECYHNGSFGYGRILRDERTWFSIINDAEPGSTIFMDEAASLNRIGRDNADIQGILLETAPTIRKQEVLALFATAASRRLGSGLREMADYYLRPVKLPIRPTARQARRYKRDGYPRGKNNPANFSFGLYIIRDNPYAPPDIFDSVLGLNRNPKVRGPAPVYFKQLKPRWMRQTMPLLDTFRPVPVAAALSVSREEVINIARGGDAAGSAGVEKDVRYWRVIGQFVRAFSTNELSIPPHPPPGVDYRPAFFKVSELHRRIRCDHVNVQQLSLVLREDMRLAPEGAKGYEILEVYQAVEAAYHRWHQDPATADQLMPGQE